jgi:hypothetical protein
MHSLLRIAFFLSLLATLVAGSPTNIDRRSFKVERVRNENFKGHNGPRELLRAYRKYSMPIPPALLDAMARQNAQAAKQKNTANRGNQTSEAGGRNGTAPARNGTAGVGIVTATPEPNDVEYLSPISIGGQTINVDFDSGSSDLWVFSTQLPAQSSAGHQLYDPTKSRTFTPLQGNTFSITYGDGSGAAGNVGTDTVDIGGVTVTRQAVEMATAVSRQFVEDTANNGLLGLAFSKLNTVQPQQQKTFFDNVMPTLAEPVFTADLRKNAVGAYEFGRIDNTKFTGQMAWIPANTTQGFWQFASTTFAVNNGAVQPASPVGQAIADTGTTLILGNVRMVQGYYSQVVGATNDLNVGGITVPCDAQLPDLMLDVGGVYMARIKGSDINFARVQGNSEFTCSQMVPWTE